MRSKKKMASTYLGHTKVMRKVVSQSFDGMMNDFILTMECGHVAHVSNRWGAVRFETHCCNLCSMLDAK